MTPTPTDSIGDDVRLYRGDAAEVLRGLPTGSVNCCVTSPPYWGLRRYLPAGHPDAAAEVGTEETPAEYVARLVAVFREVRRVLADDGTLWVNLASCYANDTKSGANQQSGSTLTGSRDWQPAVRRPWRADAGLKKKDLIGLPWMLALALQADGWWLRSEVIWEKPSCLPEGNITDRPSRSHEHLFLLAKSADYYYDLDAVAEPVAASTVARMGQNNGNPVWNGNRDIPRGSGHPPQTMDPAKFARADGLRNRRTVWRINPEPTFDGLHFAKMPRELVRPCVRAGCPPGGWVLDPFGGSGTVALVAVNEGRKAVQVELNPEYHDLSCRRLRRACGVGPGQLFGALAEDAP